MQALQDAFDRVRRVIDARAKDETMAAVPGGTTGLLVRLLLPRGRSTGTKERRMIEGKIEEFQVTMAK